MIRYNLHVEASDIFGVRGRELMGEQLGALPPHTRQSVEQQLAVLWLESGAVERFPDAPNLARYAGLVPRVRASGGHTRLGPVCRDVNHHLKWAFVEAANLVAVARHRAEAAYWILKKREVYREPEAPRWEVSSTHG